MNDNNSLAKAIVDEFGKMIWGSAAIMLFFAAPMLFIGLVLGGFVMFLVGAAVWLVFKSTLIDPFSADAGYRRNAEKNPYLNPLAPAPAPEECGGWEELREPALWLAFAAALFFFLVNLWVK